MKSGKKLVPLSMILPCLHKIVAKMFAFNNGTCLTFSVCSPYPRAVKFTNNCGWLFTYSLVFAAWLQAAEVPDHLEGDAYVKAHSAAAEEDFARWKATGKLPDTFGAHAERGARADLCRRVFTGDKLAETEIRHSGPATACIVDIRDTLASDQEVLKRITKDRFEIWTANLGKLYDDKGRKIAEAHVPDAVGGAFLPDGRWLSTYHKDTEDSEGLSDNTLRLGAFSARGKRLWSIRPYALVSVENGETDKGNSIGLWWAASNKSGSAWVLAVKTSDQINWVKLSSTGDWKDITCPWRECMPQLVGSQSDRYSWAVESECRSDDGKYRVERRVEGRSGIARSWPVFHFAANQWLIPDGNSCNYGILPDAWAVFIEAPDDPFQYKPFNSVWFFNIRGDFWRWVKGNSLGASLSTGGLWVLLPDGHSVLIGKDYKIKACRTFATSDRQALVPVSLHDDIRLGMFRKGKQLVMGTWR